MRITIFGGTGAIGSYFATALANAGHEISIIGKENSNHLKHIINNGLTIETSQGSRHIDTKAFSYIGPFNLEALSHPQELVIVALKQPDFDAEIANK